MISFHAFPVHSIEQHQWWVCHVSGQCNGWQAFLITHVYLTLSCMCTAVFHTSLQIWSNCFAKQAFFSNMQKKSGKRANAGMERVWLMGAKGRKCGAISTSSRHQSIPPPSTQDHQPLSVIIVVHKCDHWPFNIESPNKWKNDISTSKGRGCAPTCVVSSLMSRSGVTFWSHHLVSLSGELVWHFWH